MWIFHSIPLLVRRESIHIRDEISSRMLSFRSCGRFGHFGDCFQQMFSRLLYIRDFIYRKIPIASGPSLHYQPFFLIYFMKVIFLLFYILFVIR